MHTLSAVQTVEKLNTRELSAHQVLDFLNKRIDLLDPKLNAFLYRCTAEVSDNKASTILAGLPISFKDQYHIEGLPCSFGMPKAKSSAYTANLVQVLLDNGANILGKTSLPPFAMDFQTSNEMRGFCNNPWNRLYTCGGSSGGGAAAIASGMSLIDFGTDLAGSLRIPASFCGVYSLLPSEGRLSNEGIFVDESQNIDHFARTGPITRTIEDLDFIWRVLMDTRPLEENAVNTRDLKIAFWQQAENLPVDQDIITAMNDTLDQWRANGHNCRLTKPTELSFSECWQVFGEMMGYEVAGLMNPVIRWFIILTSGKSIKNSPNFIKNVIQGYRRNNKSYQKLLKKRQKIIASAKFFFDEFDVWIVPVTCNLAFKHMKPSREQGPNRDYFTHLTINNQYLNYCDSLTAFTSVTGLIGHPVVTMPIGLDTNGLPIGLQLVGKMNGEQELLKIARQLSASINFPNCPIF